MVANQYGPHWGYPGIGTEQEIAVNPYGNQWGYPFPLVYRQFRVSGAARDAGNSVDTAVLRPGLLMGQTYATGLLKQWDPSATDGSQRVAAILPFGLDVTGFDGTNQNKFIGLIVGGSVTARGLLVASNSSYGIDGDAEEYNVRAQMSNAFTFDDDPMGYLAGNYNGITKLTASTTLSEAHMGTLIHVAGTGAVTLTLPATAKNGQKFRVYNTVDQNLILAAGTADTMIVFNDVAADSVALQTSSQKVGGGFEVIGDGSKWLVTALNWTAQTITIAT